MLHVAAMKNDTALRYLGHCQICSNEQKLRDGKLVHHGYQRPGFGSIVGDCYGVDAVPYEVSCELTKKYRGIVRAQLAETKEGLRRLKAGEVKHLLVERRRGWNETSFVDYCIGVTNQYDWEREIDARINGAEHAIRQIEREIGRLTSLIDNWKPSQIRTIEEQLAELRAAKEERAKETARKRAERLAKIAATKAKQDALKTKRAAIVDEIVGQFVEFAKDPKTNDSRARDLYWKVRDQKKYQFIYMYEIGRERPEFDTALIKLNLARREDGRTIYA